MSRIKTMLAAIAVTAAIGSHGAAHDTVAYQFAGCAGRFSAEMEHAWLMNGANADSFGRDRATFVALTDASLPPNQGRAILSHRIETKLAHSALLQRATFGTHPRASRAARQVATRHLAACRALLLGS